MKTKILSILLILISFVSCRSQEKKGISLVSPKEFSEKITESDNQLIDVRTPKEFQNGHLKNAKNIHLYDQDFGERIDKLDKNKPVYVYCKAGGRSEEAVEILKTKGFETIIELKGGTDSWTEDGLPLEK